MDIYSSTTFALLRDLRLISVHLLEASEDMNVRTVGEWILREVDLTEYDEVDRVSFLRISTDLNFLRRQLPAFEWFFPDKREGCLRATAGEALPQVEQAFQDLRERAMAQGNPLLNGVDSAAELLGRVLTDPELLFEGMTLSKAEEQVAWSLMAEFLQDVHEGLWRTELGPYLARRILFCELQASTVSRICRIEAELSEEVIQGVQQVYEGLLTKSRNTQQGRILKVRYPSWVALSELFDYDKIVVYEKLSDLLWRNINACMLLIQEVRKAYLQATAGSELGRGDTLRGLPFRAFLTNKQLAFVQGFQEAHGHWPVLFILYAYLLNNQLEDERAACLVWAYGLRDGVLRTEAEVAEQLNFTTYRVRCLIEEKEGKAPFELDWTGYEEWLRCPVLDGADPLWKEMALREGLPDGFNSAVALLCLSGRFFGVQRLGACLAINVAVGWEWLFGNMREEKELYREYGRFIHPLGLIERLATSDEEREALRRVLCRFAGFDENDELAEKDVWALDESPKAYSEIVVSILRHKGVPMTHDEIREAFVQRRSCLDVPANILSFIVGSEEVAVRGRDGMFRLKEWAQFNNSPVRNLAVQCLMETEDKVHVSMIIAYLWKHGVQSTKEKVLHALRKDVSGLVLDVGKDYFRYRR